MSKLPKQKKCRHCLIYKDKKMFHKSRANKDGLVSYCKPCAKMRTKEWKNKSKKYKKWQLSFQLKQYGATIEIYNELMALQGGKCAICKLKRLRGKDKYLHLDHCHDTGKIRGLLCYVCNTTLGKYEKWKPEIENYLNKETKLKSLEEI